MAADKETREVEIVLNAQQANASIKDMAAGVALMNNQLAKMSQDDPRREQLKKDFQELKARVKEARDEINGLTSAEEKQRQETEKLAAETAKLEEETAKLNKQNKEAIVNGQKQNASFAQMKDAASLLEKELHQLNADDPGRKKMIADYQALQARLAQTSQEMKQTAKSEEELRLEAEKLNKTNQDVILNGQKLNSSYKDMKASAAQLEKQLHEMNSDAPGRKKMLDDYHALQDRIAGVSTEMKGATAGTSFLKQGFANAFAMFTGGGILALVSQLFSFLSGAKDEFMSSAKSSADLEATLHATKNAAGLTAAEIRKIGEERAKVTLFDDDETNRASAMLLTFKNVKKGVFEDAIPAIQDLATKMAGDGPADMKGASIQLGKALNDPIKGITALTRVGVTFTDQQKEQIAAMVKAGDVAGAQKLILAELNSEFGGAAKAAREAAGGVATWTMRWNEIKETVGSFVSGAANAFSSWLGRVLDNAGPLVDMLVEIGSEFANYYREVMDVVEGMGLFSEKTDTAKMVVDFLKGALTLVLMPLRLVLQVSKALVDTFIEWYNKSEMLRGVLGGLGAVIVSVFTTIKDDAIKILGGVGDIIVGIFTLDKDKIVAGFKSALAATADAALVGGARAAQDFIKGYEGAKNNRIVRRVSVETSETSTGGGGGTAASNGEEPAAGESAKDKKAREAAEKKAKAERDKADRERLNDMKAWIKQEGNLLEYRNTLKASIGQAGMTDEMKRQEEERQKVMEAADKKVAALTGLEVDYTEQVAAIVADRDMRLRELWEKHAEEEEKRRQEAIDKQIAQSNADAEVLLAQAQLDLANGVITEQQYQDAIYAVKQAAMQRELDLIQQRSTQESVAWKKLNADKIKDEAEHTKKVKGEKASLSEFNKKMGEVEKMLNSENVKFVEESLGKQTVLFKAFSVAKKALAVHNIGLALVEEIQGYWKTAADYGPVLGPIYGVGMSGLATLRSGMAIAKIAGFAKGGATGDGATVSGPVGGGLWDMFAAATGMSVGPTGKLSDGSGHEVAGIVHKNEYVIPEWLREDPQVMQVEGWLEQRRLRGYAQGGATTDGGSQASADQLRVTSGGAATDQRMVQVLDNLDKRLQGVEQWATSLEVVQDLLGLDRDLEKVKKVKSSSAIRPK